MVDSSRNGNGPVEHLTGGQAEMQLWIKAPGNADGCAAAGLFVPELAWQLAWRLNLIGKCCSGIDCSKMRHT
ncbi:hypothetical protein [Janthinobacterium agaricidamnosum]|uniref:Uncharacterized protein n=1 Tax=Janthinobacterium agaricidamnosum NBRC 102515 = DSM 9628 TaxID=1349767 RepID=W0V1Y4_9BURK|nr:hypothetical protein [Janthinobacterium agaricidamnosum]CDG81625.1 hypothetical protein GJA_969 [Janthinobacterium agaricidamnosum NBRC 102515 = DSM 9628]